MRLTAVVPILLGIAASAQAQEAWLAGTVGRSTHALFGTPDGVAAGATFPLRGQLAFRVTYDHLDDTYLRFARACGGLVPPPPACTEEQIDDATAFRGFAISLVATVVRRKYASLRLIPGVSVVSIRTTGRGRQTGNVISNGSEPMIGIGGGAEVAYAPKRDWPVLLNAGAHITWIGPVNDAPLDAYAPFAEGARLTRLDLGVSVGRRRRP